MRRPPTRLLLIGLAYLGFVGLGLPDGLLGVAWPSLRRSFGLPLDALGPLLVAITTGSVLASFSCGRVVARIGVGRLLALGTLAIAASALGYASAPGYAAVVAWGGLAGLGAGAIDAGTNTWAATHHGPRVVNWLHACWGLGAAAGPLLMTGVLAAGHSWRASYTIVGLGQAALACGFAATAGAWGRTARSAPRAAPPAPLRETLRLASARLGMAAFFLYVAVEAAAGAWAYSLLTESRGVPPEVAGRWVSLYWGALTLGRFAFGWLAAEAVLGRLLRMCIAAMALAAVGLALDPGRTASGAALALLGLACGPVFPSLIAATPGRLGPAHTANTVGFQVASAAIGQSLAPALLGVVAGAVGLEVLPVALAVLALALLVVHERLAAARPVGIDWAGRA